MASSRKRRGSKGNNGNSNNGPDAGKLIRENVKCPVCMEVLLPPIYQCETGHNICYTCVESVEECPLCREQIGECRNFFAEELVSSMKFPCKYEDYGCTKILLGSDLKDHQENCECQPYRCPELACQEVSGLHQMSKHLDRHGFKVLKGDAHEATIDIQDDHFDRKTEYNPWRICAYNKEFYAVFTRQKDGSWYFWIWFLGLTREAKKYSSEIAIYSDDKQVVYRGIVYSLRTAPTEIMKNGSCLILSDPLVKSLRQNGQIHCRIRFIQGKDWDVVDRVKSVIRPFSAFINKENVPSPSPKAVKSVSLDPVKKEIPSGKASETAPQSAKKGSGSKKTSKTTVLESPVFGKNTPIGNSANLVPGPSSLIHGTLRGKTPGKSNNNSNKSNGQNQNNQMAKANNVGQKEPQSNADSSNQPSVQGNEVVTFNKGNKSPAPSKTMQPTVSEEENEFVLKMREILRCASCNDIITPPVYMCGIGHSVCQHCKVVRMDCALCRAPMSESRNFFAEELLYRALQKCSFAKLGCDVCLPSAQMRLHETSCAFAPFECPFNTCRHLLGPKELFEHLKSHQINVVENVLKIKIPVQRNRPLGGPICTIPSIVVKERNQFYPVVVHDQDGGWSFWVTSQDHVGFRFELFLTRQCKTLAFQGPVLSIRTNATHVVTNGLALMTNDKEIKNLKFEDKLDFYLRVYKTQQFDAPNPMFLNLAGSVSNKTGHKNALITTQTQLYANMRTSRSDEEDEDELLVDDLHMAEITTSDVALVPEETSDTDFQGGSRNTVKKISEENIDLTRFSETQSKPKPTYTDGGVQVAPETQEMGTQSKKLIPKKKSSSVKDTQTVSTTENMTELAEIKLSVAGFTEEEILKSARNSNIGLVSEPVNSETKVEPVITEIKGIESIKTPESDQNLAENVIETDKSISEAINETESEKTEKLIDISSIHSEKMSAVPDIEIAQESAPLINFESKIERTELPSTSSKQLSVDEQLQALKPLHESRNLNAVAEISGAIKEGVTEMSEVFSDAVSAVKDVYKSYISVPVTPVDPTPTLLYAPVSQEDSVDSILEEKEMAAPPFKDEDGANRNSNGSRLVSAQTIKSEPRVELENVSASEESFDFQS